MPWPLIGRRLKVRETLLSVEIFDGPRLVARHRRGVDRGDERMLDPSHRPARGQGPGPFAQRAIEPEQRRLLERVPEAQAYLALLRQRRRGSPRDLRWLTRIATEYPTEAVRAALAEALRYGMADLERLERMVLRQVGKDFLRAAFRCRQPDPGE